MPFETRQDTYVRETRVRVCGRCRRQMPEVVQNRGAYNTGGSIAGSLGGSVAGSMAVGEFLGPVGAIGGAIAGAMVGSRAGAAASDGICNVVESTGDDLCPECKAQPSSRSSGQTNWGGGRLGSTSDGGAPGAGYPPQGERTYGEQLSDATAGAGRRLSEAGSTVGGSLSGAAMWLRQTAAPITGGPPADEPASQPPKGPGNAKFVPFGGGGRTLGGGPSSERPTAPPRGTPGVTAGAPQALSQEEQDAAFARQLQEQFLQEDQQQQGRR